MWGVVEGSRLLEIGLGRFQMGPVIWEPVSCLGIVAGGLLLQAILYLQLSMGRRF